MKKVFVVTDNKVIFEEFKKVASKKNDVLFEYFCSPKSIETFSYEISSNQIKTIIMKENANFFISNDYDFGISCHSKQLFPAKLVNQFYVLIFILDLIRIIEDGFLKFFQLLMGYQLELQYM